MRYLIIFIYLLTHIKPGLTQSSDELFHSSEQLVLQLPNGDTIRTGEAFLFPEQTFYLKDQPPLVSFRTQATTIPAQQRQNYPFRKVFTVPFPEPDTTITPGENGAPPPIIYPTEYTKTPVRFDPPIEALPFQRNDINSKALRHLDMEQGLPSSTIWDIVIDHKGLIWFASQKGLVRYDGKQFRLFTKNDNALVLPIIRNLMTDHLGNLWMGYGERSLVTKFDGHYFYQYNTHQPVSAYDRTSIAVDGEGTTWVSTAKGITRIDEQKTTAYNLSQSSPSEEFDAIGKKMLSSGNKVWFVTKEAGWVFNGTSFSRLAINIGQGKQAMIPIQKTPDDEIWFNIHPYHCVSRGDSLDCYKMEGQNTPYLQGFVQSTEGEIWTSTTGQLGKIHQGILSFFSIQKKLKNNTSTDVPHDKYYLVKLIDSFGRVWLSSQLEGVKLFNPNTFKILFREMNLNLKNLSAIYQDKKGHIWLGQHGTESLVCFDGQSYQSFTLPKIKDSTSHHEHIIRAFCEDPSGDIWVGCSNSGLYKFDGQTFTHYGIQPDLVNFNIYALTLDAQNNLWIGSSPGGLTKYDGKSFTRYVNKEDQEEKFLGDNSVRALTTDLNGNVWAATQGGGLRKFDGEKFTYYTTKEGLSSNIIVSLFADSKGILWIGTRDQGVMKYDGQQFTSYTTEDGLSDNAIWTITEDAKGQIWLGADNCLNLLLFNNNKLTVAEYCNLDGLMGGEFFANSSILDQKGNLWWGTNKATATIHTDDVAPIFTPPSIYLDEIKIAQTFIDFRALSDSIKNGKSWWLGRDKDLNAALLSYQEVEPFHNYPINLKLPYQLNNITFQFSATNYPNLDKVVFSYMIEGLDKDWSIPSISNQADYRNLPYGSYTLKVKAAGIERIWSEPFSYSFFVLPPWYHTWWAYLAYILIFGTSIYLFYQFQLNRRLEKAEAVRVKEMDTLKTQLYTNITHEFRTPLTVIMGVNENIKGNENEKALISRNSKNLLRLVNQLLDLSKLDSGKMKLDKTQGDIVNYLQYLTESFYSMAKEKNIRLVFYPEVDELVMDYDEIKIQHIVYNLLSNAIKFTPKGGRIIFHLNYSDVTKNELQLKVKDSGIGISDDKLPFIFDRFYQADSSHTRKGEGTGIGLALTKELIELMGGNIKVKSKVEEGSEFIIRLPITQTAKLQETQDTQHTLLQLQRDMVPELKESPSTLMPPITDQQRLEILIIEDNRDVFIYIETLLRADYEIRYAKDGQEGIFMAQERIPDLIISDVMMPEKDGYEVCETLKQDERTSHIPIILLTAKAEQDDRVQGLKYGADAYLTKPFHKEELLIRIEKLLELRHQLQLRYSETTNLVEVDLKPTKEELFIQKLKQLVEEHLEDNEFGVPELAKVALLSQMQVYRKLKALTGQTPSQFIRTIRLQKGKKLLLSTDLTISEIAYEVGFSDPNYFSRTFQQEFGKSPREMR